MCEAARRSETYRLLADANFDAGRKGEAVYRMLRHWEMVWPTGSDEAALAATEANEDHGAKEVVTGVCAVSKQAKEAVELAMEEALAAGHPVLAVFDRGAPSAPGSAVRGSRPPVSRVRRIEPAGPPHVQAAFNKGPLSNRSCNCPKRVAGRHHRGGLPAGRPPDLRPAQSRHSAMSCDEGSLSRLAPPFDLRGEIQVDGSSARMMPARPQRPAAADGVLRASRGGGRSASAFGSR